VRIKKIQKLRIIVYSAADIIGLDAKTKYFLESI
jgi:hypothetical protein